MDSSKLGSFLVEAVKEIDGRDGLVSALEQLGTDALRETGKRYRDESLTAWLLAARLGEAGVRADVDKHFLELRDQCDLMVHLDNSTSVAVEIRLAWKKWLAGDQSEHISSSEEGHVPGDPSAAFERLEAAQWPQPCGSAVLLVGFDSVAAPMDDKISAFEERQTLSARGWKRTAHEAWLDRRNADYRIASWFWQRD